MEERMARVGHFDMMTRSPEKAVKFYSGVFGWKFYKWGGPMEYWLVGTGDRREPGIDGGMSRGKPVKDLVLTITGIKLDKTLKLVQKNGGKVVQPRGPIPGVGWYAAIKGPDGNLFGLMEDDPKAK